MKVGNTFVSKKDFYDLKTGEHYQTKIDTVRIVGTAVLGNDTCFVTNSNHYIINKSDGYWTNADGKKDRLELEAKFPGSVGDTFSPYQKPTLEKSSAGKMEPDTIVGNWEIIAKDQQITVPAGTFRCWEYQSDHKSIQTKKVHFRTITWFAPGHGIIKSENYYHTEDGRLFLIYREELLSEDLQ